MSRCKKCRYVGVAGLLVEEAISTQRANSLGSDEIKQISSNNDLGLENGFYATIFFPGANTPNYTKINDSKIVVLNNGKVIQPFNTAEGRVISDISVCFGTFSGSLDELNGQEQEIYALAYLIDSVRELSPESKLTVLTQQGVSGCCSFKPKVMIPSL